MTRGDCSKQPICEIKQDFPPPEVGNYQLYQIALLFPLDETAYAEGPVICVKA